MLRYADSRVCPDCRARLVSSPRFCPSCALPLQHPLASELFETLSRADVLLGRLRTEVTVPTATPVPATGPAPGVPGPAPTERRTGLSAASVPVILLGLGALCLIVAAVTFLAITWSWMGVGGRTGVLVCLTLVAAGTGVVLGRRGLRVAAESLTTVSLGMVALDVVGAVTAGWLGTPDLPASAALVGVGVAAFSGAVLRWSRLVALQLGVVGGLVLALAGVALATGHDGLVAFLGVVALAAVGGLGGLAGARVLSVTAALAAVSWWVWLLVTGVEAAITHPSWAGLWASGQALPLLGASTLLVVVAAAVRVPAVARASGSGAASIVTLLVALPALDEGATAVGIVLVVALIVWSAVATAVSRTVAVGPLALAAVPAAAFVALHSLVAGGRVWGLDSPFASSALVRLDPVHPGSSPLLLVPLAAALLAATWAMTRRPHDRLVVVGLLVLAAVVTVASYAVPLALLVGLSAVAAPALARLGRAGLATGAVVATISAALPSAVLTAVACAGAVTVAAVLLRRGQALSTLLGGLLLPAASAGLVWSLAEVADLAVDRRAVPVLVVLGILAIARPRVEVEATAAVTGLMATLSSLTIADASTLAVDLTAAGVLLTLSSLLHQHRRVLAWPGGGLLAGATWVRLADLGVSVPEAYTLPSAAVLILVALHRLRHTSETSTAVLVPGLTLATVPSLLWVLVVEPVGPRAVLLGVACLVLVLAGSRLSWSAPLAVGSLVGGLLVVREVAPYTGGLPQWALIGMAGTVLIVVGVTWESRLRELRRAAAYLGRLR